LPVILQFGGHISNGSLCVKILWSAAASAVSYTSLLINGNRYTGIRKRKWARITVKNWACKKRDGKERRSKRCWKVPKYVNVNKLGLQRNFILFTFREMEAKITLLFYVIKHPFQEVSCIGNSHFHKTKRKIIVFLLVVFVIIIWC
jgi:hypothetical protein